MIETRDLALQEKVLSSFAHQGESLMKTVWFIMYYFRGAMSKDDAWNLTPAERDSSIAFIQERFKEAGEMIKAKLSPSI